MRTMGLIYLIYIFRSGYESSNDISITFNFPDTYFHQDNFYILQNHTFASGNKSFVCYFCCIPDCKYRLMVTQQPHNHEKHEERFVCSFILVYNIFPPLFSWLLLMSNSVHVFHPASCLSKPAETTLKILPWYHFICLIKGTGIKT